MSKSLTEVALSLRLTAQEWDSQKISSFLKWQKEHLMSESKLTMKFDLNRLAKISTTLLFHNATWDTWDAVDFSSGFHVVTESMFGLAVQLNLLSSLWIIYRHISCFAPKSLYPLLDILKRLSKSFVSVE